MYNHLKHLISFSPLNIQNVLIGKKKNIAKIICRRRRDLGWRKKLKKLAIMVSSFGDEGK